MRSPLASCGIEALGSGPKAIELLVKGLESRVDQDSAEVAAAVLCLMLGAHASHTKEAPLQHVNPRILDFTKRT